jgi:ribosomal protein L4
MKAKALFTALSKKFKDGEVFFLDQISLKAPKTKDAKTIVGALAKVKGMEGLSRRKNAAFIAMDKNDKNVSKSFNNFGNLEVGLTKDLNVLDLMQYRYLLIANPEKSLEALSARLK